MPGYDTCVLMYVPYLVLWIKLQEEGNIRIEDDDNRNDGTSRHHITPEADNDITGDNFEGDQGRFKNEEVPTSGNPKGIVNESSGEPDEG